MEFDFRLKLVICSYINHKGDLFSKNLIDAICQKSAFAIMNTFTDFCKYDNFLVLAWTQSRCICKYNCDCVSEISDIYKELICVTFSN